MLLILHFHNAVALMHEWVRCACGLKKHYIRVQDTGADGSYVCLLYLALCSNQGAAFITHLCICSYKFGPRNYFLKDWLCGSLSHIQKVIMSPLPWLHKAIQQPMTHRTCRLPHCVGPAFTEPLDCCAQGAQCLATALRETDSLEVLRLDDNPLAEQGGSALAAGVWQSQSLRELHLCNTGIGDEGDV